MGKGLVIFGFFRVGREEAGVVGDVFVVGVDLEVSR